MSHRKSIPVQNLLYFNNFLEFPYFFRGYNFKYIYFYNKVLMFFIHTFFVNIFGFSINMLRIDYLKENINIYIDFLNVSYYVRVGKVYNKSKYLYIYRNKFLLNIFKYSDGVLNKWLDRFVYMRFVFHKYGSLLSYRRLINLVSMCNRNKGFIFSLNKPRISVFLVCHNMFYCFFSFLFFVVFIQGFVDFSSFIFWFYCFFVYILSLIHKKYLVFNFVSIYYKKIYSIPYAHKSYNISSSISELKLLDFIYMYNTFYINITESSSFLLYYLKLFFVFMFYNFIFFNKCWNFCFVFFNFFKYICYCWPSINLYKGLVRLCGLALYSDRLVYKYLSVFNSNYCVFYYNYNLAFKFNSYVLKTSTFLKYNFVFVIFKFNNFFSNLFFVFKFFISCKKFIFCRYKPLWDMFGTITAFDYDFGGNSYNIVNADDAAILSSDLLLISYLRKFRYKSKLYRSSAYMHTFKMAYVRLYRECFFRRFNYVGFFFKRFFNLNTFAIYFFKSYSCGFFNKKNFYFISYFVYKVEFLFQLLVQCGCKDLFFYYLAFFFKNWYFLSNFFFKILYYSRISFNFRKKKNLNGYNFFFFSKKFLVYFCKYFGKRFRNLLFFFSKKKLKYLYSFSMFGFFRYKWYNLDKLSLFDTIKYVHFTSKYLKNPYCFITFKNIQIMGKSRVSTKVLNKLILLGLNYYKDYASYKVLNCNFGSLLQNLVNSITYKQFGVISNRSDAAFRNSLLLVAKLRFQCSCNFSELYVYSFLLEFNINFLKGLSLLFCFFHFNLDFFFKFYINIYFMNFVYFCEFFYLIFSMKLLFNFYFLKLHLSNYNFCGFLGLYMLIFKFSKNYINITGIYILNYIFDIFFHIFMTNRYRSIKYILRMLSNLFVDFLELKKFCGFNFKIKGRMSKRTQRKQCFIVHRGVLKLTENTGNLFSGKRTLSTHIGSVSIYLYINLRVC